LNALAWYASSSADATHPDQEVDLTLLGSPGGANWAYVALGLGDTIWTWGVLDKWLEEEATHLAYGEAPTELEAKAAVQRWVDGAR